MPLYSKKKSCTCTPGTPNSYGFTYHRQKFIHGRLSTVCKKAQPTNVSAFFGNFIHFRMSNNLFNLEHVSPELSISIKSFVHELVAKTIGCDTSLLASFGLKTATPGSNKLYLKPGLGDLKKLLFEEFKLISFM